MGIRRGAPAALPILAASLALASAAAWAHDPNRPVRAVTGVPGIFNDTHGGYGYVGDSESAMGQSGNFGCDPSDINGYVRAACYRTSGTLDPTSVSQTYLRPLVEQELRDKIYESLVLRMQAARTEAEQFTRLRPGSTDAQKTAAATLADQRPIPVAAPSGCVSPNAIGAQAAAQLPTRFQNGPGDPPGTVNRFPGASDMAMADRGPETTQAQLLARYKATTNQFNIQAMFMAVAYSDQLDYVMKQDGCTGAAASSATCVDLAGKKARLSGSFPTLFDPANPAQLNGIRTAYQGLVGAGEYQRDITRKVPSNPNASLGALDDAMTQAMLKGFKPDAAAADRDKMIAAYNAALGVTSAQEASASTEMAAVCGGPSGAPSLDDLVRKYPNVARQMLNDLPPNERQAAQAVLCTSPALDALRAPTRCDGMCGSLTNGGTMKVCRSQPDFPYATKTYFSYSRPDPNGPVVVSATLYLKPGPGMKPADAQAMAARLQGATQDWYNCQAGNTPPATVSFRNQPSDAADQTVSCPPDPSSRPNPPMRFNITMQVATDPNAQPVINLQKCWRTELQSSNCDKVRNFVVADCQKNCAGDAKCKKDCASSQPTDKCTDGCNTKFAIDMDAADDVINKQMTALADCNNACGRHVAPAGSPELNREDAGDYTTQTDTSTAFHEVGHILGLPDEYQDPSYAFNLVGPHDSIMNAGGAAGRLYPDHFAQMMRPALTCSSAPACGSKGACDKGYPK